MERFRNLGKDFSKLLKLQAESRIFTQPPDSYLEHKQGKTPVILIPGLMERWGILRTIADSVSENGHDVYTVPKLGDNVFDIETSADIVEEIIKDLDGVDIIAHSKGGLIAEEVVKREQERPIKKVNIVFALNTPFYGSNVARLIPYTSFQEMTPRKVKGQRSKKNLDVSGNMISIFSKRDDLVSNGSFLDGARNFVVPLEGHHLLLDNIWVVWYINKELELFELEKHQK